MSANDSDREVGVRGRILDMSVGRDGVGAGDLRDAGGSTAIEGGDPPGGAACD